jgi:endonuclease YncB( thermonuclease family)
VTDDAPPPRAVILQTRDGRPIPLPSRSSKAPPSPSTPALQISGPAQVADIVSLTIRDRSMPLFGVRAPQASDRCSMSAQSAPRACSDAAREALATRLKGGAMVSCRVPPGQRLSVPAAICVDATGIDLGGFLVAEGFALADTTQSYEYVGAEDAARSFRRGLWHYR